jgi:hypothetical protein
VARALHQRARRIRDAGWLGRGHELAVLPAAHHVGESADVARYDREAVLHGLEHARRHALATTVRQHDRRQHEGVGGTQPSLLLGAVECAHEAHACTAALRGLLERGLVGAITCDHQLCFRQQRHRFDRVDEPFDRHQAAQAEQREALELQPAAQRRARLAGRALGRDAHRADVRPLRELTALHRLEQREEATSQVTRRE